jgi:hypothetical protein
MSDLQNLQDAIDQHISQVKNDVASIENTSEQFINEKMQHIDDCKLAKLNAIQSFSNWSEIWPALNIWLSKDQLALTSFSSVSYLHGLVSEWRALRAIASEVKVIK